MFGGKERPTQMSLSYSILLLAVPISLVIFSTKIAFGQ